MQSIVVLLALLAAQLVALQAHAAGATAPAGPRVALGVDAKGRYLQLSDRIGPVYPTADVTCDGNRRTITLTRSSNAGDRIVSTYAVPPKVSEGMLKSVECRLLLPDREIAVARQQIRAAWSTQARTLKH